MSIVHALILIDDFGSPAVLESKNVCLREVVEAFGPKAVFADVIAYAKAHRKLGVYKVSLTQRNSVFDVGHYEIALLLEEASLELQKQIVA